MHQPIKLKKNIEPWPLEWDLHLFKTFEFYFDNESPHYISFLSATFYIDGKTMNEIPVIFKKTPRPDNMSVSSFRPLWIKNNKTVYTAILLMSEDNTVYGSIFRLEFLIEENIDIPDSYVNHFVLISIGNSYYAVKPLGVIEANNAYSCAEKIETIISSDNDSDDNDRGGNTDLSPTPEPSLSLKS